MLFERDSYKLKGLLFNDTRLMARFSVEALDYPEVHPYFIPGSWRYGMSETRIEELLSQVLQYYPE